MASFRLFRKGGREQFVAKSDGTEYVRCSNRAWGYFFVGRVSVVRKGGAVGRSPPVLCQHRKAYTLRVSRSVMNDGRPYFTCQER